MEIWRLKYTDTERKMEEGKDKKEGGKRKGREKSARGKGREK